MTNQWMTGYCTNVHAGTDIAQIRTNLDQIAVAVRDRLASPSMGVGLWIPAEAAAELAAPNASAAFAAWLADRHLVPFTINGFPYGNFHQAVVKHRVYLPTWWEDARRDYTLQLVEILHQILPAGVNGSISTLPLGWGEPHPSTQQMQQAAANLKQVAARLEAIEQASGRRIVIAIEPEPGCVIDTTDDMIQFFDQYLPSTNLRRYLTVCHDICHAAVMCEEQSVVLQRYADAGIGIGKVQVSSAIEVPWHAMDDDARHAAIEQLTGFAEDRYLHQTMVVSKTGDKRLVEDLPELLGSGEPADDHSWRIHFHVPIYLDRFGQLHATRQAVVDCIVALSTTQGLDFSGHLEAETYAWGVLPSALKVDNLADGIAEEMRWLQAQIGR
ncbi:Xylose isomerase-like TIM barrel [Rosistilla carotiformis]|uniref:Xylose isomerase-like TIM barrel n=1 Tax=Rosistilla carotiformis TaxID=2528017 RepID=A0A518JQH3_9BACT|nr:metabolite traffic protein EboE [Rosistilla carotiformis]QDV67785.1 Xylose isomerase-like TIM barrel [Rosistilla carotiformis]